MPDRAAIHPVVLLYGGDVDPGPHLGHSGSSHWLTWKGLLPRHVRDRKIKILYFNTDGDREKIVRAKLGRFASEVELVAASPVSPPGTDFGNPDVVVLYGDESLHLHDAPNRRLAKALKRASLVVASGAAAKYPYGAYVSSSAPDLTPYLNEIAKASEELRRVRFLRSHNADSVQAAEALLRQANSRLSQVVAKHRPRKGYGIIDAAIGVEHFFQRDSPWLRPVIRPYNGSVQYETNVDQPLSPQEVRIFEDRRRRGTSGLLPLTPMPAYEPQRPIAEIGAPRPIRSRCVIPTGGSPPLFNSEEGRALLGLALGLTDWPGRRRDLNIVVLDSAKNGEWTDRDDLIDAFKQLRCKAPTFIDVNRPHSENQDAIAIIKSADLIFRSGGRVDFRKVIDQAPLHFGSSPSPERTLLKAVVETIEAGAVGIGFSDGAVFFGKKNIAGGSEFQSDNSGLANANFAVHTDENKFLTAALAGIQRGELSDVWGIPTQTALVFAGDSNAPVEILQPGKASTSQHHPLFVRRVGKGQSLKCANCDQNNSLRLRSQGGRTNT